MTTIAPERVGTNSAVSEGVVGGVDTHKDTHTAAAVDLAGRLLGTQTFPTDAAGYRALLTWLQAFGPVLLVGVEGTGVYGAGLVEQLQQHLTLVEVDRPDRRSRRFAGKSDPLDAVSAARAALGRVQTGTPKRRGGPIDALRTLRVARRSAVQHRATVMRQLKALLITAPEELRGQLRTLPDRALIRTCAALRPAVGDPLDIAVTEPVIASKVALRSLARRYQQLTTDIDELDALLTPLVAALSPDLLSRTGVGVDSAGQLLVTAGDNPERIRNEAAFAALTGTSPVPASSGRTRRHRLNRGGDRNANCTLYRIVLSRLRYDARTRAYVERRTQEGLSKKEIIRCLKRYIAREIYNDLARSTA